VRVQDLIAWLGLITVVWSMCHYAAPLIAVSFALLIQAMRRHPAH
jgi:hypothetical protein